MPIYTSIDQLIGKTPLIELVNTEKKYNLNSKLFAKLEYFNPAGSVKDRVGLAMINEAEKQGELKPGGVIIEPTSGNTGIGIAAVAAARGYRAIIVMPETMSEERRRMMKAYGAELVLTDGTKGMAGAIEKANELMSQIPGSMVAGQFENPANAKAHYETTGPEIYDDMNGNIDFFVSAVGTGGTITGVGKFLKEKNPNAKIIAVEPSGSPVLSGGKAGSHQIQGIGAGFVPEVLDLSVVDEIITVSDEQAFTFGADIGKTEGFLVGISSGAAIAAALEMAKRSKNSNARTVVLLPDGGDRYLSTRLFA